MEPNDWRVVRVGDLVAAGSLAINDGYRVRNAELGPVGIPFVRGGDIGDGWIQTEVADHIRPEFQNRVAGKLTKEGDIAFITKGTVGRVGYLRSGQPSVVFAPQVCYWRVLGTTTLDSRFLYFLLKGAEFQANLDAVKTHGSMVADYVSLSDQRLFRLRLPGVNAQRAIGRILGSLDDNIELNRRMNETLEAVARTLFHSWFVDFDPVRAKAEGTKPHGIDAETAKLFPDKFEDSPLGKIPKGWRAGTVADFADTNAWTLGNRDPLAVIDYVEISEVSRGEVGGVVRYERGAEPSRARRRVRHGDTVLSTVRPDRGAYFLVVNPPDSLIVSTGFAVLTPRSPHWTFLHSAVTQEDFGSELGRLADGGAYPAVRPEVVGAQPAVIPDAGVQEAYHKATEHLFLAAAANRRQSQTLAAVRDALLPKLLSGELRVSVADRLVEAAP